MCAIDSVGQKAALCQVEMLNKPHFYINQKNDLSGYVCLHYLLYVTGARVHNL